MDPFACLLYAPLPAPQVLRYFGWFGEPVPDSPLESWRVRRVQVLLYLEDETMQVTESSAPNSGIMQVAAGGGHFCRGVWMHLLPPLPSTSNPVALQQQGLA